jgi:hypothetical protein
LSGNRLAKSQERLAKKSNRRQEISLARLGVPERDNLDAQARIAADVSRSLRAV